MYVGERHFWFRSRKGPWLFHLPYFFFLNSVACGVSLHPQLCDPGLLSLSCQESALRFAPKAHELPAPLPSGVGP